jgi:hypothetical protein
MPGLRMRPRTAVTRLVLTVALALGLAATPGLAPRLRAEETAMDVLRMAARYSDLLRDSVAILGRGPDPAALWSTLYDARRAVAEIDRLAANASIFQATPQDRDRLQAMAAEAHLYLALFETHGLEFERSRQEIARARGLSDHVESPGFRTPWVSLQSGEIGHGLVTAYHLLSLTEFEAALGSIWYRARPVPFEFHGLNTQELLLVSLSRLYPASPGSLDDRLLALGTRILRDGLDAGKSALTVPLPPGLYRLQGRPGAELDRSFIVPEVSNVDAVVVDRARFDMKVEPRPGPRGPRFFLNGVEVRDLTTMPYGVYRVKADEDLFPGAPQVVRFVLGEGLSDKTRTAWTVYVPAGGSYLFQIERAPFGQRLRR